MSAQSKPSPAMKDSQKEGGKTLANEGKGHSDQVVDPEPTTESVPGPSGTKHACTSDTASPLKGQGSDDVLTLKAVAKKPKLNHGDPFAGPGVSARAPSSSSPAMSSFGASNAQTGEHSAMDHILSSLRLGQMASAAATSNSSKTAIVENAPTTPPGISSVSQLSDAELLAKLQQQQAKLEAQQQELASKEVYAGARMDEMSNTSTNNSDPTATMANDESHPAATASANALFQQQQQRISALQTQLAQRDQQMIMSQQQPTARVPYSTNSPTHTADANGGRRSSMFNANAPPFMSRQTLGQAPVSPSPMSDNQSVANSDFNTLNRPVYPPSNAAMNPMRVMSGPAPSTYSEQFSDSMSLPTTQHMQQFMTWQAQLQGAPGVQPNVPTSNFYRPNNVNRRGGFGRRATNIPGYGGYGYGSGGSTYNQPMSYQIGMYSPTSNYASRPGTSLSGYSSDIPDFSTAATSMSGIASLPSSQALQTYINRDEPVNYRRMLDKAVNCNWKFIVDKIVHSNDQQASIFLQQKLKVGTAEQKFDIIEAIIAQAYPLMVNRFGNFLVQRCFEHGTPEQVVAIANSIRGNTLSLSMDPFGCHVIQKAFDSVPEEFRVMMVNELLRRIPETVIHRYACHVWQKLFELRWTGEPPAIMKYVNDALYGMWHEVALGETGSLVVQNIFENCVEEEKRQCIEEVLANIDLIAHGQFGNWCIQHICEHGAPNDMRRAVDHVLLRAVDYSIDQYASKVVEKCLKIKGNEFLSKYLAIVCEAKPERPRMPLIDIAADQYGNYLIQYILGNATHHHREMVASHVRKHMVSLRGSKFGSRVAMLCCNPAHVTRPGPGAGVQIQRYGAPGQGRFGAQTYT